MKAIAPASWVLIGLLTAFHAAGVVAASVQEKPVASATQNASKKPPAAKKKVAKKTASSQKKRAPIASKSKSAHEVAKTPLPPANLDLSLPHDMVQQLQPPGKVPLPKRESLLPSMFEQKPDPFQLNGRLLNNEMQLPLRNSERREVEGAALDFEFKR
ncbi:translation initiation factor 2 [Pseudomonas corrugata]|uniref:Translation initiation factor 2 n=1 Tax=Pseudomonas corrugata TaxID=47879 RepID=A0A7Y5ZA70_9PSED|nr:MULTISPECIES: translation initiation factor 2 [Pseudomonas]MCI0994509.1 translation initiation factor 2 [Pseudomonas corrugata]NUT68002.1 translation initiation factor 2 [Pseudomonas corrugata]NUT88761.1 translation initiation factor 2 [Pseudomonas corrugata]TNF79302.1 translation initiation factor 2 [Pseudomonas sp. ICMP22404]